ncbi:hypothetical protein HDU93_008020 [Gonapodya sp. JEL0774]|nr:hypothetical protein HDU93_008020 [Gonapodya sp. JEL0774]
MSDTTKEFVHPSLVLLDISPVIGRGYIFRDASDESAIIPEGTLLVRSPVLDGVELCAPSEAARVKNEFEEEQRKKDAADAKAGKKKPKLGSEEDVQGRPSAASRNELAILSLALHLHERTKDPSNPGTSIMPAAFADLMPRSYPNDPETGVNKNEDRLAALKRFLAIIEDVKEWEGVRLADLPVDERGHLAFWMEKVARNALLKSFGKAKRKRMIVLGGAMANVNHACLPNSVWKLKQAGTAGDGNGQTEKVENEDSGSEFLEVWSARDIVNGEEITIPYVAVR